MNPKFPLILAVFTLSEAFEVSSGGEACVVVVLSFEAGMMINARKIKSKVSKERYQRDDLDINERVYRYIYK